MCVSCRAIHTAPRLAAASHFLSAPPAKLRTTLLTARDLRRDGTKREVREMRVHLLERSVRPSRALHRGARRGRVWAMNHETHPQPIRAARRPMVTMARRARVLGGTPARIDARPLSSTRLAGRAFSRLAAGAAPLRHFSVRCAAPSASRCFAAHCAPGGFHGSCAGDEARLRGWDGCLPRGARARGRDGAGIESRRDSRWDGDGTATRCARAG